jgi:hypothetical protein
VNFKDSAMAMAERLSSWHVMQKSVIGFGISKMQLISFTRFWTRIVSHKVWDIEIYSALAVDNNTNLKVIVKIGREKAEIDQEVGVRQGDDVSLVIFLFLMSAFAETQEKKWK